jgi:hypothetical protein
MIAAKNRQVRKQQVETAGKYLAEFLGSSLPEEPLTSVGRSFLVERKKEILDGVSRPEKIIDYDGFWGPNTRPFVFATPRSAYKSVEVATDCLLLLKITCELRRLKRCALCDEWFYAKSLKRRHCYHSSCKQLKYENTPEGKTTRKLARALRDARKRYKDLVIDEKGLRDVIKNRDLKAKLKSSIVEQGRKVREALLAKTTFERSKLEGGQHATR